MSPDDTNPGDVNPGDANPGEASGNELLDDDRTELIHPTGVVGAVDPAEPTRQTVAHDEPPRSGRRVVLWATAGTLAAGAVGATGWALGRNSGGGAAQVAATPSATPSPTRTSSAAATRTPTPTPTPSATTGPSDRPPATRSTPTATLVQRARIEDVAAIFRFRVRQGATGAVPGDPISLGFGQIDGPEDGKWIDSKVPAAGRYWAVNGFTVGRPEYSAGVICSELELWGLILPDDTQFDIQYSQGDQVTRFIVRGPRGSKSTLLGSYWVTKDWQVIGFTDEGPVKLEQFVGQGPLSGAVVGYDPTYRQVVTYSRADHRVKYRYASAPVLAGQPFKVETEWDQIACVLLPIGAREIQARGEAAKVQDHGEVRFGRKRFRAFFFRTGLTWTSPAGDTTTVWVPN